MNTQVQQALEEVDSIVEMVVEGFEKEINLVPDTEARQCEKEVVRAILQEANSKILERFYQVSKVKDVMTENKALSQILFDVCQRLGSKIPVDTGVDAQGNETVEYLEFVGSPSSYSMKQLGLGALYAAISIESIKKENDSLKEKLEMKTKEVLLLNEELESEKSKPLPSISSPSVQVISYKDHFSLYNPDTKMWISTNNKKVENIEDLKPEHIILVEDQDSALFFPSIELAHELRKNMIQYRNKIKKKYGEEARKFSKLKIRNPHKFQVCQEATVNTK